MSFNYKFNFHGLENQFAKFNDFDILPFCSVEAKTDTEKNDFFQRLEQTGEINTFKFKSYENKTVICSDDYSAEMSEDFEKIVVYVPNETPAIQKTRSMIMQLYKYTCIKAGGILIHSACVEFNGEGVLFCGLSGAGKSTQAHLWEDYASAFAVNLDQPYIFVKDGRGYVCGSPFSGKESAYEPICVPVRGIIFVNQATDNSIKKLPVTEAYSKLYLNNYTYPISNFTDALFNNNISALAENVDVYSLNCDISRDAVAVAMKELFGEDGLTKVFEPRYKQNNGFYLKRICDKLLLFDKNKEITEDNVKIELNEAGLFLWNLLNTKRTADELAFALAKKYDIGIDCALKDVACFVDKCLKEEIIIIVQ